MFVVNDDLSIYATRGDIVCLNVSATDDSTGSPYEFQPGDIVRMKIFGKKDAENVVMQKDFPVIAKADSVAVFLSEEDTKIGDVISKPRDYWYEIELNPYTNPQTIVGYDEDGAKIFKLFPEGKDLKDEPIEPEDIPVVDTDLDLTSSRPVENKAIARAVTLLKNDLETVDKRLTAKIKENRDNGVELGEKITQNRSAVDQSIAVERARIDNLLSGATADGSEVVDIRVGADGETYESAGTAVREQFNRQKSLLCGEYVPMAKGSPLLTVIDESYVNGTSGVAELTGYAVSHFTAQERCSFYIEGEYTYLTIALLTGGIDGHVTAFYRDATLPTEDSMLEIESGVTVAISYNSLATFTIHHNSAFMGYKTNDALVLGDTVMKVVNDPVNRLRGDTVNDAEFNVGDKSIPVFTAVDGYTNGAGVITDADKAMYKTYYATADRDYECYIPEVVSSYFSLCLYDGEFQKNFVARYRESDTGIPTKEAPLLVKNGQTIAITVVNGDNFKICANNSFLVTSISDKMLRGISSRFTMSKKPCLRYVQEAGTHSEERFCIYIPTVVGYVGYDFAHVNVASINADSWRIIRAFSCDNNFVERFDITNAGEWEMAIKIEGRDDFIGGSLHGDEVAEGIAVLVDGVKKTASELTEPTSFDTLRILESTRMYDPANGATKVATHGKEYVFTDDGLLLKQLVAWETAQRIGTSYMTMLPIYRGNITDTFYCDYDYTEYDVSSPGALPVYENKKGVRSATIYSNKSGVCANVEVTKLPDTVGGDWFQVSGSDQYNKLYFACAGFGCVHTTVVGERWETETRYHISVNVGTDV